MKIVTASDTHNSHALLQIPECDIFIHSGDATWRGKGQEIRRFARWMKEVPAKHKVFVPGNHDYGFQTDPDIFRENMEGVTVLIAEAAVVAGIHFYGSPWTPYFHNWAFNFPEFDLLPPHSVATEHWSQIPVETQFLVTHGPPSGMFDMTARGERVGDPALNRRINTLTHLVYHQFGHIHEDGGVFTDGDVVFNNASILNRDHLPLNPVRVFQFDGRMHLEEEILPLPKSAKPE